jgi:hypothetical protein
METTKIRLKDTDLKWKKHTHIPRDRKTNEHLATLELLKIAIQTESDVSKLVWQ